MSRPCVLVFAGADPSGGAGIQADGQAIAALGAHALTVITVLTAQDNDRVHAIWPLEPERVRQQAQPLIDRMPIAAVKVGIVGTRANALAIAALVRELRARQPDLPLVVDPVLASGQGQALAQEDPVAALAPLLELATLVTPNLVEAGRLCGGVADGAQQAAMLAAQGARHVLIKGGHGDPLQAVENRWYGPEGPARCWSWPRLEGSFHGSGCTLASAIAALLAQGLTLEQALQQGQEYCQDALAAAYAIAPGQRMPARISGTYRAARPKE